jgi:hypothetical protein
LIVNDDEIILSDQTYVRKKVLEYKDTTLYELIKVLLDGNLLDHMYLKFIDTREYTLRILKYLCNFNPNYLNEIKP